MKIARGKSRGRADFKEAEMVRKLTILMLVAAMAVPLAGCGRKGKPIPPEGSTYPRAYPDITFPKDIQDPPENQ